MAKTSNLLFNLSPFQSLSVIVDFIYSNWARLEGRMMWAVGCRHSSAGIQATSLFWFLFVANDKKEQTLFRKIISIVALIMCFTAFLSAQERSALELTLPSADSLKTSLERFYEAERDALLHSFDAKPNGAWRDLLPSVGITYTVQNDPRPAISWSPIGILNRKDNKKRQELDRQSIIMRYEVMITDYIFKLQQLVADYELDLSALEIKQKSLLIDERLYSIELEKYNQSLSKPSEYLNHEKQIVVARAEVEEYTRSLSKQRSAVLYHAKY